MDAVQQRQISFINPAIYSSQSNPIIHSPYAGKNSEAEQTSLLKKVQHYLHANQELHSKQNYLQSTVTYYSILVE